MRASGREQMHVCVCARRLWHGGAAAAAAAPRWPAFRRAPRRARRDESAGGARGAPRAHLDSKPIAVAAHGHSEIIAGAVVFAASARNRSSPRAPRGRTRRGLRRSWRLRQRGRMRPGKKPATAATGPSAARGGLQGDRPLSRRRAVQAASTSERAAGGRGRRPHVATTATTPVSASLRPRKAPLRPRQSDPLAPSQRPRCGGVTPSIRSFALHGRSSFAPTAA